MNKIRKFKPAVFFIAVIICICIFSCSIWGAQDISVMTPWINSNIIGIVTDDINADLKDDFYLSVNHDYLKNTTLKPGDYFEVFLMDTKDLVEERALEILEDDTLTGHDAHLVQNFYTMFLDWESRNEAGIEPIMPSVEELMQVGSIEEMTEFLLSGESEPYGIFPADISIEISPEDSSRYAVSISSTPLSLGDSAEYTALTENGKRRMQRNEGIISYMLKRVGFGEDQIHSILTDAADFETKIAQSMKTRLQWSDPDALKESINPVTMEQLSTISPSFPLARYMESYGYSKSELIYLKEPDWLKTLDSLYNEENLSGLKAYLLSMNMTSVIQFLDEDAFRTYQDIQGAYTGTMEHASDRKEGYSYVVSFLPNQLARLYIERYLDESIREEIRNLCLEIIGKYQTLLDEEDWLSPETKEMAKNKLAAVKINALYPDTWEDDSMFRIVTKEEGGTFAQAALGLREAVRQQKCGRINQPVNADYWDLNLLDSDAYYRPEENSINIIAGFLGESIYSSDMTTEEKYGGIGTVIGHEISHAFDTTGAQYDAQGNVKNWWKDEDYQEFQKRADKLAAYYDNVIAFDDGTPCRGQLVQTEAIADMAGVRCMLKMAEKTEGFDYDVFFRTYIKLWAMVSSLEFLEMLALSNPHPLFYLRGNVTVQQYDEFYETYDITEGDGMYMAPEDRIAVW